MCIHFVQKCFGSISIFTHEGFIDDSILEFMHFYNWLEFNFLFVFSVVRWHSLVYWLVIYKNTLYWIGFDQKVWPAIPRRAKMCGSRYPQWTVIKMVTYYFKNESKVIQLMIGEDADKFYTTTFSSPCNYCHNSQYKGQSAVISISMIEMSMRYQIRNRITDIFVVFFSYSEKH